MRRAGIAAVLAAGAVCAFGAAPGMAHTYGGKTAKGGDISFRVSPGETHFIKLRAERELRCRKGRVRSFRPGVFRQRTVFVRVAPDGTFRGSVRVHGPRGSLVRRGRFSIRGRTVNELRAKGFFRERHRLKDGTRCDSRRVRFSIPLTTTNG